METSKPKIAKVLRVSFTAAKWTIVGLASLIVLFVAVNAFDEELSPEARALLVSPPSPYDPARNLYLAVLGLEAPPGTSPITAARERLARYEEVIAIALKDPSSPEINSMITGQEGESLKFQGKVDFCRPLTGSCVAGVEVHKKEIGRLLDANRELMRRYTSLHRLDGYHETGTPSLYFLPAFVPTAVRQLYLSNVALLAKTGNSSQQRAALTSLRDDIGIWRMMLVGKGTLVSKMIAVASLQSDYAVLSDIIADRSLDIERSSQDILEALNLVKEGDWKLGNVYAEEFRIHAYMWNQLRLAKSPRLLEISEDSAWLERLLDQITEPFLKITATQNLQAREAEQRRLLGSADPEAFLVARDAYERWRHDNIDPAPHFIYNPAGKFIIGIGWSAYEGYSLRAFDASAFQRLARLGYEIRAQRIPIDAIASFMEKHPQWATHPVDAKPFVWDREKGEIAMRTLGNQPEGRRFYIPVWNAGRRS